MLSLESIRILLRTNYGMEADKIEKLPLGSANCYKVSASEGTLFLKEFQSDFPEEALCREAELVDFLKQRHFPTAAILPLRDASLYFRHSGRLVYVQEFLEGRTYTNDLPKPLLMQAAEQIRIQGIPDHKNRRSGAVVKLRSVENGHLPGGEPEKRGDFGGASNVGLTFPRVCAIIPKTRKIGGDP